MKRYLFLILIVAVSWRPCISLAQDYVIGKGDILKITVYGHPDLATIARVSGDGLITMPLIDSVNVSGLTTAQVSQRVTELLADGYIVDPHVSVFVEEFNSKKTIIMGQVNKPGVYSLNGNTTLFELLSKAGGLTKDAGEKAIVKRKASAPRPPESTITIDLRKLLDEGDTSSNILMADGDSVYVAKAEVFYVTGEVKKPEAYKYEEGTTVMKAATIAGGFTDKASPGRIKIIRKVRGKETIIERADADEPVRPDDIVIVPESFW